MNKYVKAGIIFILGALLVNVGTTIGGLGGNFLTIFGGVAGIYGIASAFRKSA